MSDSVQLGVFDHEGYLVSVEPSLAAAKEAASAVPGTREVIYEIDPEVAAPAGERVLNGPRSAEMALRASGLEALTERDVLGLSAAEAHATLKPFAPGLGRVQGILSGFAGAWLLGTNTKMKKADAHGRLLPAWVMGLSLLPHAKPFQLPEAKPAIAKQKPFFDNIRSRLEVHNPTFCLGASPECKQTCLVYSGQNEMADTPRMAKRHKSNMLLLEPAAFVRMLCEAIESHIRRCKRDGYAPFFRLNVYSDIPWELFVPWLFSRYSEASFYDYTKVPARQTPKNYHLSFSYSGRNKATCRSEAERGINPVFVFAIKKKEPKPGRLNVSGLVLPVIDGDVSDVRPRDPLLKKANKLDPKAPAVVGLFYKAPKRADLNIDTSRSSFVVPVQVMEDGAVVLPSVPRFETEENSNTVLDNA